MQVVCVWLELHGLGALGRHKAGFWVMCPAHVQAMQNRVDGEPNRVSIKGRVLKCSIVVTWHLPNLKSYSTQMGIFPLMAN